MYGLFYLLSLLFLVSVRAALTGKTYGATFAGCFNALPASTVKIATQTSAGNCASACYTASTSYEYSYYASANSTCVCSASGYPTYTNLVQGDPGSCSGYEVQAVHTTFSPAYTGGLCFVNGAAGLNLNVYNFINDPQACFAQCENYIYAYILQPPNNPNNSPSGFYCYCSNADTVNKSKLNGCNNGELMFYNHTTIAASAGLSRRSHFEAKREHDENRAILCPKGKTACNVPGDAYNFECLDLSSELDSCGGCMYGQYGQTRLDSPIGKDCSANGAALGHSTCVEGKCAVTQCKKGYVLIDGRGCLKERMASKHRERNRSRKQSKKSLARRR